MVTKFHGTESTYRRYYLADDGVLCRRPMVGDGAETGGEEQLNIQQVCFTLFEIFLLRDGEL